MGETRDDGPSAPSGLWRRIASLAAALPAWKKGVLALGLLLLLGGVATLGSGRRAPQFTAVFTNLDLQEAAEVTKLLQEAKIPFRLENDGATILVSEAQVAEARLACASKGIPRGGGVGLEIFDRSSLGSTSELGERIRYQRGLQGDLARSLQEMQEVERARVHLCLSESEVYSQQQKPPSASVVLRLRPGARLSSTGVTSMVNLVSKAVQGLTPENISITDQHGRILWGGQNTAMGKRSASDEDAVERFEHRIEAKVSDMMERLVGEGHCTVSVSASLDITEREIRVERVLPGSASGHVKSRQVVDESYHAASREGGQSPTGPALATSRAPSPMPSPAVVSRLAAVARVAGGTQGNNDYRHRNTNEQFETGRESTHEVRPPGAVKQMHVSVLLDEQALGSVPVGRVESLVKTAAGVDGSRGDTVRVEAMPFHRSSPTTVGPASGNSVRVSDRTGKPSPLEVLGGAGVILGACVVAWLLTRRSRRVRTPAVVDAPSVPQPPRAEGEAVAVSTEARAASLLRTWMAGGGPHAN